MKNKALHIVGAPALFLLLASVPVAGVPYAIRTSLGLLAWMSWWWIANPVHLAITGFLPIIVSALFGVVPVGTILPLYAEQLLFLLIGAGTLATLWRRWGLDRRIAIVSLMTIGTDPRRHIVAWFVVAAILSAVLPNAVVAAALMPVAIAMLRFIGIERLDASAFGSALLIAIAWGTSVGGMGTPLGGAHNLLAVQLLERGLLHREFIYSTWITRLLPITLLLTTASAVFMWVAFPPEISRIDGSRDYFARELQTLGPMSTPERWGLVLFSVATLLAFTREFYAARFPGLTPAMVFLTFAVISFLVRHKGVALLEWPYAESHMVWGLIYLFAGGSALGQILSDTGTAKFIADGITPFVGGGAFTSIVVFTLITLVIKQIMSNTATVAVMLPITITTFTGLGLNPVPYVYIVTAAANMGLMLPPASAGPAIAAGFGVNLRTMAWKGLWLTIVIWVLLVGIGYALAVAWPGFSVA